MASNYFGSKGPDRPHLVTGKGGVAGEVDDLRNDVDEAFSAMEGGGLMRADVFTAPPAAAVDGIKLSFPTEAADAIFRAAAMDGALVPLTGGPRGITLSRSASAGAYTNGAVVTIRGKARGERVTLTFTFPDANGGDTIASNEDFGLDEILEVVIPAQATAAGAFTIGISAELALYRAIADAAGIATPLREVEAGAIVATGGFTGRKYLPPVNVPDGAKSYAVIYIADPAG